MSRPAPSGVPPCSIRCRRRRMRGARAGRTRVCPSGWFGGKDPHAQAASYPAATRPVSGGRGDPGRRAPVGGLVLAADRDRRRVGAAPVGPAAGDGDRDPDLGGCGELGQGELECVRPDGSEERILMPKLRPTPRPPALSPEVEEIPVGVRRLAAWSWRLIVIVAASALLLWGLLQVTVIVIP